MSSPSVLRTFRQLDGSVFEGQVCSSVAVSSTAAESKGGGGGAAASAVAATTAAAATDADATAPRFSVQRHGYGLVRWPDHSSYMGTWSALNRDGGDGGATGRREVGQFVWPNGTIFQGQFSSPAQAGHTHGPSGLGKISWVPLPTAGGTNKITKQPVTTITAAAGDFVHSNTLELPSEARLSADKASVYEGSFHQGLPHGLGLRYDMQGHMLQCGRWDSGQLIETCPVPRRQVVFDTFLSAGGMWYRGAVDPSAPCLPHGHGYLFTAQDELHATGMWVRGELLVTSADTSGMLQGPWRFLRSDGSELNGMWQGGNCSSGTITYADGKAYVGAIDPATRLPHGQGQLTWTATAPLASSLIAASASSSSDPLSAPASASSSFGSAPPKHRPTAPPVLSFSGTFSQGHVPPSSLGIHRAPDGSVYEGQVRGLARDDISSAATAFSSSELAPHGLGARWSSADQLIACGRWESGKLVETRPVPCAFFPLGVMLNATARRGSLLWPHNDRGDVDETSWLPHGSGALFGPPTALPVGMFVAGFMLGSAAINVVPKQHPTEVRGVWRQGELFDGAVDSNGCRRGRGRLFKPDGRVITGNWKSSVERQEHQPRQELDEAQIVFPYSGDRYHGSVDREGRRSGFGVLVGPASRSGSESGEVRYIGSWVQDHMEGLGLLQVRDGASEGGGRTAFGTGGGSEPLSCCTFEGEFVDGYLNGFGARWDGVGRLIACGRWRRGELVHSTAVPTSKLPAKLHLRGHAASATLLFPDNSYYCGAIRETKSGVGGGRVWEPAPDDSGGRMHGPDGRLLHQLQRQHPTQQQQLQQQPPTQPSGGVAKMEDVEVSDTSGEASHDAQEIASDIDVAAAAQGSAAVAHPMVKFEPN